MSALRAVGLSIALAACGPVEPGPRVEVAPVELPERAGDLEIGAARAEPASTTSGEGAVRAEPASTTSGEGAADIATVGDEAQGDAAHVAPSAGALAAAPIAEAGAAAGGGAASPAPSVGSSTAASGATTDLASRCAGLSEPACRGHRACAWVDGACSPSAPRR